jgi:hypothetical protein
VPWLVMRPYWHRVQVRVSVFVHVAVHTMVLPEPWPNGYGWVSKTAGAIGCLRMKPGCGCSLWLTLAFGKTRCLNSAAHWTMVPEVSAPSRLHILIGVGGLCTRLRSRV